MSVTAQDAGPMRIGQWRSYLPFRSGPAVAQSLEKIYYATELAVLTLDKADLAVDFLTREDGLSNVGIRLIRYSPFNDALIIVYNNSVIDVVGADGQVLTLNQIRNFTNFVGDKFIYDLFVANDSTVYIAANYGVSRLNLKRGEFAFTTFTGVDVSSTALLEGYLYAATETGIYRIRQDNANPENFGNWEWLGPAQGFPAQYNSRVLCRFNNTLYFDLNGDLYRLSNGRPELVNTQPGYRLQYLTAEGKNLLAGYRCNSGTCSVGTMVYFNTQGQKGQAAGNCFGVPNYAIEDERGRIWFGDLWQDFRYLNSLSDGRCNTLTFNSPYSSNNREITIYKDQLWLASGGVNQTFSYLFLDHGFASFIDGQWRIYNRNTRVELKGENPNDPDDDLFDIMTIAVNPKNDKVYAGSFFEGLLELDGDKFKLYNEKNSTLNNAVGDSRRTRISGLAFDKKNNLWVANHLAERPISVLLDDGTWRSFKPACSETQIHQIGIDANGYKWFVSNSSSTGLLVFDEGKIDDVNDDRCRLFTQNNSNLPTNNVNCLAVDLDGDVWVGTAEGIVIFECGSGVFDGQCKGTRRIVELDGFLEYLLKTEDVRSIAVDGGNRKWVGTKNGVFLLSSNGEELIARFTTENSPLPSNSINDIAVSALTGEVFIGTELGIISYQGDAIEGGKVHRAEVEVYPNPVRADYDGPVAIRGLARDAVVKITDLNGQLVFETRALGGQAIWNGRDYLGQRVRSGVYLVFSASNPRESGFAKPTSAVARIVVLN